MTGTIIVATGNAHKLIEIREILADPGLHRTLIGDGLATALAGLIGGPANTTYGENTGVLELSKVYDPRVIRIAACFAIVISFIPKLSELIGTMPARISVKLFELKLPLFLTNGVTSIVRMASMLETNFSPAFAPSELRKMSRKVMINAIPSAAAPRSRLNFILFF